VLLRNPFLSLLLLVSPAALALPGSTDNPFLPTPIDGPPPPEPPEVIARDERGRATLRAVRVDVPLDVDGLLEESVYRIVPGASDFIQQEPHEGEPATERTEVWVLFDEKNVYVTARCWDSQPDKIVANEMRRDNFNIFFNDNFAVILDTFYDRRNGFLFHTNPVGGLADSYVTDERDNNRDWNTVYESKSRRFSGGWTVEMSIPFKSLRYSAGPSQIWGINFRRIVRSKNEHSYLTRIPAAYGQRGVIKVSSAATLVGIEPPAQSKNLELKPYAVAGVATDRTVVPSVESDLHFDAGFDLKYGLTRSLILDFTYNTDFAQVEEDEVQVNLTRFDLFFPEKRDFFLEGQGIFAFGGVATRGGGGGGGGGGMGGEQSNTPILFFSRRIGLSDETQVPIDTGGRLTGRAGPYSIGVLGIGTGEVAAEGALATNFSVIRLKRDILRRSNVGVIATRRSPAVSGRGSNEVYGVDGNFNFFANSAVNTYYARSSTDGRSGKDASYRAQIDLNTDRYGFETEYLAVGENFNPEIGFLRREDFRRSFARARFSPRPKSLRGIRKVGWEGSLEYITDGAGRLETREAQAKLTLDFESSDQMVVEYSRNYELLPEPFEIESGVVIPLGGYSFQDVRASFQMGPQRKVSGRLSLRQGSFYDGARTEASYTGRAEISPRLTIEPRLSWNWVDLPQGRFTTKLVSTRVNFSLSPRIFVGALLQYSSSSDSLATNVRFRWEYEAGSDLFLVYNDGRTTEGPGFPLLQNRSLVVKFTRLFRF
jgi:hypothetical protein